MTAPITYLNLFFKVLDFFILNKRYNLHLYRLNILEYIKISYDHIKCPYYKSPKGAFEYIYSEKIERSNLFMLNWIMF